MKIFTIEEVQKHNTKDDCYIIIDNNVYDMSNFDQHPGGKIIFSYAGKDATDIFHQMHNKRVLKRFGKKIVGVVNDVNISKL